jgi:hypothetical protein
VQIRQSDPLEAWVDESIERSRAKGYDPTEFISMRARHKTVPAMERLIRSGQIQSGLIRLKHLGMAEEWSIEAGILKFPDRFTPDARAAAKFRLDHIDDTELR